MGSSFHPECVVYLGQRVQEGGQDSEGHLVGEKKVGESLCLKGYVGLDLDPTAVHTQSIQLT